MRRRRRRARYTWLPTLGTAGVSTFDSYSGLQVSGSLDPTGGSSLLATPILLDQPQETTSAGINQGSPLSILIGNDYIIKRIVGKFHFGIVNGNDGELPRANGALLTAGFFVSRVDDAQSPGDEATPIGGDSFQGLVSMYGPQNVDVIREPWIWRRTWILGNPTKVQGNENANIVQNVLSNFPSTTGGYGSIQDGAHIDAKSARRVRNDERLFFVFQIRQLPINSVFTVGAEFFGILDYRVLGALRKAHNRSTF